MPELEDEDEATDIVLSIRNTKNSGVNISQRRKTSKSLTLHLGQQGKIQIGKRFGESKILMILPYFFNKSPKVGEYPAYIKYLEVLNSKHV